MTITVCPDLKFKSRQAEPGYLGNEICNREFLSALDVDDFLVQPAKSKPSLKASESPKEDQEIESSKQQRPEQACETPKKKEIETPKKEASETTAETHKSDEIPRKGLSEYSDTHMDALLYKYATEGNAADFQKTLSDLTNKDSLPQDHFLLQVSPQKDTFLHIAARYGHKDLAEILSEKCPPLLMEINADNDTALHLAARAGNLDMVKLFLESADQFRDIEHGDVSLRTMTNKEGNTALHEALINRHKSVASYLIEAVPPVSYYTNNEEKSVFYLAAEAGYVELVKRIMESGVDKNENDKGLKGDSPVYAAILGRNEDVLKTILTMEPTICGEDEERTLLHLAVSTGFLHGVRLLLGKSSSNSYNKRDNRGAFPIHIASSKGYVDIMEELLQNCPDSIELLNKDNQSILHVAAKCGKDNMVNYVLKKCELQKLINQKDKDGNTPLHLATKHRHPNVVSTLTWGKGINLNLVNNEGLIALDMAEIDVSASLHGCLTWIALKSAGAQQARALNILKQRNKQNGKQDQNRKHGVMVSQKDQVNTLALVATLIVTVTFAAGFTMPGGFNNSNPNQGMATFLMKHMFQIFVVCNTTAMYSSILVAVSLIWAQLGDLNLAITALRLGMPLLGLALTMMSLAFMAGIYLTVSGLPWLANVVLVMGIIFVLILAALFLLFFPSTSSFRVVRYITYYPFRLIVMASGSGSYGNNQLED